MMMIDRSANVTRQLYPQHRLPGSPSMFVLAAFLICLCAFSNGALGGEIERWGVFEVALEGPSEGNPYLDVSLSAVFENGTASFEPEGFYDGEGTYKVRFMPNALGTWSYKTKSNRSELDGKTGSFECVKPSEGNRGPVGVVDTFRLAYADGTPHFSIGTTCYAWAHQGDEMEERTLDTLSRAPFNKLRMCVFPKHYSYNRNEPVYYAFPRDKDKNNDFTRFNPEFFRHFEDRVADLLELGIEADIILLHPYDRWGYEDLDVETADRYLRYVVARLAAYRHVWWSMANEYDLMENYTESDWDHFFRVVQKYDPYGRLRSIHNCHRWYDHTKPWVTHASVQTSNFGNALEYREKYKKPILYDECKYEGNVPQGWGNISAERMVYNFWAGTLSGTYVGHGETFMHPEDLLWWAKGGVLRGESPGRIAFLKSVIEDIPYQEMNPDPEVSPGNFVFSKPGELYFIFFDQSKSTTLQLPGDRPYKVDEIDTWNGTVKPLGTANPKGYSIAPSHSNYLIRLTPYGPDEPMRPEANASADVSEGIEPLDVRFEGPANLVTHWDFGDGTVSSDASPKHTYSQVGVFTPVLSVTDETTGLSSRTPLSVRVFPSAPEGLDEATEWPGVKDGIRFLWRDSEANDNTHEVEARDGAGFDDTGAMVLGKGSVIAKGADEALLEGCRSSNQLSLEFVLSSGQKSQTGPARIVTFSLDHGARNFTLGQNGKRLALRLRTSKNGGNANDPQVTFPPILKPDRTTHVLVTYLPGHLRAYYDGKLVHSTEALGGDFATWEECHLLFGDEWVGGRAWKGTLDRVAIYDRFIGEEEAKVKYRLYKDSTLSMTTVPVWEPYDFAFKSSKDFSNPFDVEFGCTLTGPDGTALDVPGFYDGGGTWKVRVSANCPGLWELSTASPEESLNGKSASFEAVENPNPKIHGGLRIDPERPRHFVFEDGTRYFLMGYECDWIWALDMGDPDLPTLDPFLDRLEASGFNHIILNGYAHDTSWRKGKTEEADYGPPPQYAWEGNNKKPDHSRFNLEYWKHYDDMIEALAERGIVAHLMIKVYNKKVKWPKRGSREDDLYFRWLVARYAAYPNIVWDFSKESYNEKDQGYKKNRLQFVRDLDPFDRLLTLHDDKDYGSGAYDNLVDFHSDQNHKDWHNKILSQRKRREWPVVNVEFGYEHGLGGPEDKTYRVTQSGEENCRRAWEVCMAGGYAAYYYTFTAWDVIRPEEVPPGYALFKHLRDFFEGTDYSDLEPSDDLVTSGYCLANPGSEYIVYLPDREGSTLTLDNLSSSLSGEWYHPFTGERVPATKFGNAGEKATITLDPPATWESGPFVLHLGKGE